MLRGAGPESHNSWVALLHGLNGSVPDPGAVDSRKGRPPAGVGMDATATLTGAIPYLQLVIRHVPVHRRTVKECLTSRLIIVCQTRRSDSG